jgi:hypothetical protein
VGVLCAAATLATGCASAAQKHSTTTTTAARHAKTTTTTAPKHAKTSSKVIFTQSLSGTKHTKSFTAKSSWQLSYYFNCSGKKGKFTLYLRPQGKHSVKVTSQQGLGGGGARTYSKGTYSLAATTGCKWTVKATKK